MEWGFVEILPDENGGDNPEATRNHWAEKEYDVSSDAQKAPWARKDWFVLADSSKALWISTGQRALLYKNWQLREVVWKPN